MKCVLCQQEMMGGTPRWKCINSKCPDYFEPAAAHPLAGKFENNPEWDKLYGEKTLENAEEAVTYGFAPPTAGPGIKLDIGKPLVYTEFLMQFPRAIRMVARVGEAGSQAPGHVRSGWKTVPQGYERYSDAMGRHILDEIILATEADQNDPLVDILWEAATCAWNSMARLEHLIRENRGAAQRLDPTARS